MKGLRGTMVLLVVVGALLAGLYYSDETPVTDDGSSAQTALDGRKLSSAVRLVIHPAIPGQSLEFGRGPDGALRMEEPLRDLASFAQLQSVANVYDQSVLNEHYAGEAITESILSETGLDAPRASLEAEFNDGHRVRIEIGSDGPFGSDLFVRKNGVIWLAQRAMHSSLQGTYNDYRERLVFGMRTEAIDRVAITQGDERYVLDRSGSGGFTLTEPELLRLDATRALTLVGSLSGLRVDHFLEGAIGGGIGPELIPQLVIELQGLGRKETVQVFEGGLRAYHVERGVQFSLRRADASVLQGIQVQALRATWVLPFSMQQLQRVTIDPGLERGKVIELIREGDGGFVMRQPLRVATEATPVRELLDALRDLQALEFVEDRAQDLAPYGLDSGYLDVRVEPDAAAAVSFHVGSDRDQRTFMRRADERNVVAIDGRVSARLRRPWTAYATRTVLRFDDNGSLRRIELVSPGGGGGPVIAYQRALGEDIWKREGEEREAAEIAEAFEDLLRDLRSEQVVDPSELDQELGEPRLLRLCRLNGDAVHTLRLWSLGDQLLVQHGAGTTYHLLTRRDSAFLDGLFAG